MSELGNEIDSLKRQHDAERPDESVDMQEDEDELMEQGAAQLREQLEEDESDDEIDMDEGDNATDDEEKDLGTEKTKHQLEHIEEEKEMANSTSKLSFNPTCSQSTDKAKALCLPSGPSCTRTEEHLISEEKHHVKQEEQEGVVNTSTLPFRSLPSPSSQRARASFRAPTLRARDLFSCT